MSKWRGGVIRSTQITPSGGSPTATASGVWRASDAAYWVKQSLWPGSVPGDPFFKNTTLLLSGDGINNANNNTIVDETGAVTSFTRNGTTSVGSFSAYGSRWSNYFDGSGDWLSFPNNAALQMGAGDFTVEAWIYITGYDGSYGNIISTSSNATGSNGFGLIISPAGAFRFFSYVSTTYVATGGTIPLNQWVHVAVSRASGTLRLFIDGALSTSVSNSDNFTGDTSGGGIAGWASGNAGSFTGYVSNLRVIKGTALYTSAFTPPTTPLTAVSGTSLLTCQSNRLIETSTNNFTITRTGDVRVTKFSPLPPSAEYNATTDGGSLLCQAGGYNTSAFNGAFTADFTIEGWFYMSASNTNPGIYTTGNESSGRIGWFITNGVIGHNVYGSSTVNYGSTSVYPGQWTHIAIVRSGSIITAYVNGIAVGTQSMSGTLGNANQIFAGGSSTNGTCHISGYRIIRGTALYTSNFTPPTTPPTAITNTMLLLNYRNAGIFDATSINVIDTVGNTRISTAVSKFGGSSVYFDGTGDWLYMRGSDSFHFASGNFTMEGWFYFTSGTTNAIQTLFSNYTTWGAAHGTTFWGKHTNNSGYVTVWFSNYSTGAPLLAESSMPPNNTWTHYALVRNGNTFTLYRNGTSTASASWSGAVTTTPPPDIFIGTAGDATQYTYPGYIDDFRITKGIARYTANFTPPTAAHTLY